MQGILPADGAVVSIASWDFGVDPNGHPPFAMLRPLFSPIAQAFRFGSHNIYAGVALFVAFLCSAKHLHVAAPGFHFHCVQDELARMMADGRLKVIVESEFPFTQQGLALLLAFSLLDDSLGLGGGLGGSGRFGGHSCFLS